jgi:hypothetical protein
MTRPLPKRRSDDIFKLFIFLRQSFSNFCMSHVEHKLPILPVFSVVRVPRYFCVVFCKLLFVLLSFCYFLVIVLFVLLRFTASDNPLWYLCNFSHNIWYWNTYGNSSTFHSRLECHTYSLGSLPIMLCMDCGIDLWQMSDYHKNDWRWWIRMNCFSLKEEFRVTINGKWLLLWTAVNGILYTRGVTFSNLVIRIYVSS